MNSRRRRVRNIAWRICAAAFLCAAASGVPAQTVYKQVDAAGRITFADQPDMTPSPRTATISASDVENALASNSAISSRRAAIIDANEASRRLGQAQLEREQGAGPLPGEQAQGSDASVMNHRYWRRQEKLRQAVEQAKRRWSETRGSNRAPPKNPG